MCLHLPVRIWSKVSNPKRPDVFTKTRKSEKAKRLDFCEAMKCAYQKRLKYCEL